MNNLPGSGELNYLYPPSKALILAAKELGDIDPTPELSQLTDKGVFDLAWRSLAKFCKADVEDSIKPQPEEIQAAIVMGMSETLDTKEEIAKKYDAVYRTAVSGLCWILSKAGRFEVTDAMIEQFAVALPQIIDQTLPGSDDSAFIRNELTKERDNEEKNGFMTTNVSGDVANHRMWSVLKAVPEFAKYTSPHFMVDPTLPTSHANS